MNKIIILDIPMQYGNNQEVIHPVVLCDANSRVLVDCGYVGSLSQIEEALRANALMPEEITHLILTHQDHDHVGAAAAWKRKYPATVVMASAREASYMDGTIKSLRLEQAEQLQKTLPPEQQAFGEAFCGLLRRVEPVTIDRFIDAWEPFCGGCQVIDTPGHTPGHISLYLPALKTLLSGDAMALGNDRPVIANPQFTLDREQAASSMQRLLSVPAERIICYHGGVWERKGISCQT